MPTSDSRPHLAGSAVNRDGSRIQGLLFLGEDLPIQNVQSPASRFHVAYATWNRDANDAVPALSLTRDWQSALTAKAE
jgi:hypothetical protein